MDYGDSFSKSYAEYGDTMVCIRLEDKLNRFKQLTMNGNQQVNDESLTDTLRDTANYAIMALMERENVSKKTEDILQGHASIIEIYNSHNDV